ncbi:MAG: hypothetical protein RBT65_07560 [Methanolobus sp.]|nr:hypothetical protein [Clostridia bacterium]MDY0386970.1 hypothetical protein [Methanolobus sp.]
MIITIPTISKEMVNGEIKKTKGEMKVNIDTSFLAHLKWEEQFQSIVGYDLATYTEMVKIWLKDKSKGKSHFLGLLKLLYCYVNSDELPTFKDFCKLFDVEIADEILKKISAVLEEVSKVASKN